QREDSLGDDLEHLCWARLALTAYRDQPGILESLTRLDKCIVAAHEARPKTPYLRANPLREALTALALAADCNSPFVLPAAAIALCQREGAAEVIVAEGPGHWRNVEYLVAASGLGDVLRHYKVPFVDLNHDEPVKRPNLGRLTGLSHLYLSRTIDSADVILSLPKLKSHHWAVATLALMNLFVTLPGIFYGWH